MAGIYKRGKIYWARTQRKGREHRHSLETTDFRTAQRRFKQWIDRLEAANWGERPRVSFDEAVRQFMLEHFPRLKPKSAMRYGLSLKWLADRFGGKFLDEITRAELGEFEVERRSMGVSSPTIRRDLACLSSLLSFCESKDWIEDGKNVVHSFLVRRKESLKEGQGRTRWLRHAEEGAMLALASTPRFRRFPLYEAIMLAIDTGLREQEQFSLTWPQVDLVNRVITTSRDTKNNRARAVPLTDRSAQFLAQWKADAAAKGAAGFYVFKKTNGRRFKNLYRGFKILAGKAEIADICWHDLRRTAGCRWLNDYKRPMHEVSLLLGHSGIKVTEKSYAFMDQLQLAMDTAAQKPAHMKADSQ